MGCYIRPGTNDAGWSLSVLLQEELSWQKLEPIYVREYGKTFSEKEVAGMIAFLKSPAGQACVKQIPTLTHNIILYYEKNMAPALMQKVKTIYTKFITQLISAGK